MTYHGFSCPRLDVERLRASASLAALTATLSLASVAATAGMVQASPPTSVSAFFTVDPQDKRVYQYDGAGLLVGNFALIAGNDSAHGLTSHLGALHVLDSTDRDIYEYDQSGTFQAVSRELRQAGGTTLSTTAGALAIDGDELWVVDRGQAKLLRYSLAAAFAGGAPLDAAQEIVLDPANASAEGLTIDAVYLYVLDQVDRQLYRYRRDGTGSVVASRILAQLDGSSTGAPYGAALAGGSVFVVDASRDKIFTYGLASLFSGAGNIPATSELGLDPANGNAQDVAVLEAPTGTTTTTSTLTTTSSTATISTTTSSTATTSTAHSTSTSTTTTTLPPGVSAFFTVDPQDKRVYEYDAAGLGSFHLLAGNDTAQGLTLHSGALQVLDRRNRKIYEYDQSGTFQAVSRELRQAAGTALSTRAGALAIDEDDLWVVDRGKAKLFRYSLAAAFAGSAPLDAAQEIVLDPANARAEGLTIDAVYLYVLDQIDRQLYRYQRDGSGSVVASRIMAQADGGALGAPYGVALAGGSVFVVDASRDKIFTYDLAGLFSGTGNIPAISEFRLDPANGNARDLAVVPAE
jgi:sugar lactone lactonase YvrE